jgi:hypothetical protein
MLKFSNGNAFPQLRELPLLGKRKITVSVGGIADAAHAGTSTLSLKHPIWQLYGDLKSKAPDHRSEAIV